MEFESQESFCKNAVVSKSKMEKFLQKLKFMVLSSIDKSELENSKADNEKTNSAVTDVAENYGSIDSLSSLDLKQFNNLIQKLQYTLKTVRDQQLKCEILVPCGLITKVAQDIVQQAYSEPYGLRGCMLYINLEGKNQCRRLAKFSYDPNTVATFELHLTLKEETRRWCFFKKVLIALSGSMKDVTWSSSWKLLCSSYQLQKKKLYRKN